METNAKPAAETQLEPESEPLALVHTIYVSRLSQPLSPDEIEQLLQKTRKANKRINVTGMLLLTDNTFFQVLEGEASVLDELYAKIIKDSRHNQITKIITEPIEVRAFSDWTMGYVAASEKQLREIRGMNDFFKSGTCLLDIDRGRAKKLLRAFSRGRWQIK